MSKNELIRLRVSEAEKKRLQKVAKDCGISLSTFVLEAALFRASEATRTSLSSHHEIITPAPDFPGKATSLKLSDGTELTSGKKTYEPRPK